jgi:putative ABC transport system permease protein
MMARSNDSNDSCKKGPSGVPDSDRPTSGKVNPVALLTLAVRLVGRATLRHPALALLNLISVALGVAVFTAILTANRSATSAFQATVGLVTGQADLEIRGSIPEEALPKIRAVPGVKQATPSVEWIALRPDQPGEYLRVLGIDPFTTGDLRGFSIAQPDGRDWNLETWLSQPDALAVSPEIATTTSGPLILETPVGRRTFQPRFTLESREASDASATARLAAMDLAWAQDLSGQPGRLTSILLVVDEDRRNTPENLEALADELRALLPADVTVQPPAGRTRQTAGMLASFQLNLTALSLVSMLVGCYLIYNAVAAAVLRRRWEIGVLRSLGASPLFLRSLFLGEAALLGFLGAIGGLLLSLPLAGLLTGLVARTITSLYVLLSIEKLTLSWEQLALGLILGTLSAIVAAWIPAGEATQVDPREVLHPGHLEEKVRPNLARQTLLGLLFLALAAATGWTALAAELGWIGFLSAFLVVAGFSLLVPLLTSLVAQTLGRWMLPWSPTAALGLQNLGRSLSRNAFTIAALAAALAMLVSISVMIHSFRGSVEKWMNRTLVADVFAAPAANEIAGIQQGFPPEVFSWLTTHPSVREIGTFREETILLRDRPVSLGIFFGPARGELEFLEGDSGTRSAALDRGEGVAISESLSQKFGLKAGDDISLPLPGGTRTFSILGTYRDYTRDSGVVLVSRSLWQQVGGDDEIHSVAIFLDPSADSASFIESLRQTAQNSTALSIYGNQALKARIGEIFAQTFAVTGVLRLIALVVAIAGILLGLGILVQERARQTGILRSVGASPGQIFRMVLWEAGAIGAIAATVGLVCGAFLALVLTYIINKAYFGWTVTLQYPLDFLLPLPLWVLAIALLAATIPAWRAIRTSPGDVLRAE